MRIQAQIYLARVFVVVVFAVMHASLESVHAQAQGPFSPPQLSPQTTNASGTTDGAGASYPLAEGDPASQLPASTPQRDSTLNADYQQAPGASESAYTNAVYQNYQFFAEHYDDLGSGPHAYGDYAPQGYYPLDYQEAPGAPLYQRIRPPAATTREDLDKFVVRGPVPGSFIVPGTSTAFRFSGFVRMGANFDFDPIDTPDLFVPRAIPVPQEIGQNVNFSARPTRLTMDTWTPVPEYCTTVHTFIQFDFLSGNPPGVGSSSNPRLRFAFFDVGYFRVGQDTTVFMDPSSFPRTVDFNGPNGIVNSRQGLVRMTLPLAERVFWASAIEQPFSDITTLGLGENVQDVPDFTSHLRYEADLFHAQAATVVRSIGYRPTNETVTRETGWGVNLTSNFHPWAIWMGTNPVRDEDPSGLTRSRVLLQYAFGSGIGRYIQDSSGQGLDGALDLAGEFDTLDTHGYTVSYEHWFNKKFLTNLTYSNLDVDGTDALPGNTFAGSDYVATSLWYVPVRGMSLGIEYLYGERENLDGARGKAERIQTAFQYNF